MNNLSHRVLFLAAMALAVSLSACKKPGPAEEVGRKVDQEAEQASDTLRKGLDKAQDSLKVEKNQLRDATSDADITARVKVALMMREGLDSMTIRVTTHEGVVTLSGSVAKATESELATRLARAVDGVVRVNNNLSVVSTNK